jgi:multisubunit Na+/H+ antiporter MnhG subunit
MTEGPGYRPDRILRGLTLRRRLGYVAAGLGGTAGAMLLGLLWITEPTRLPARTQFAFTVLILIGVGWAAFAAWALIRRPLFAVDRVAAASLALTFSTLLTAGMVVIALTRANTPALVAAVGLGVALLTVASLMVARARAYRAALLARRRDLEKQLPVRPQPTPTLQQETP